jgi:hypothetical protein
MKRIKNHTSKFVTLSALILCAAGSSQANTIVTFSVDMSVQIGNSSFTPGTDNVSVHGTFDGWTSGMGLVQQGSSSVYTNTLNDTTDANGAPLKYKFVINGSMYEQTADFNNRAVMLPTNSGALLVLPTPYFADAGSPTNYNVKFQVDMSQQIALGTFTNAVSGVEVRGNFNGWSSTAAGTLARDTSIRRTNQFGVVTSNVYTGTLICTSAPNAAMDFKYVIQPGGWESVSGANDDGGGNRFFANTADQTNSVVDFADSPFAPLSQVSFKVDMSAVPLNDPNYILGQVYLAGSFNNWSTSANLMTNNPSAANTNVYTVVITTGQGANLAYKFTYQNGGVAWENPASTGGGNRTVTVPNLPSVNLPTVFFNDIDPSDLLNVDTVVTFSVNMTNATEYQGPPFNPSTGQVFINGDATLHSWQGWDIASLASYQCTNIPPAEVYYYTVTVPKGHSRYFNYKYGIYDGSNANSVDNEAAQDNNHGRYVRGDGVYNMPMDTFGSMGIETKFGNLAIGKAASGHVPITWTGYPGVSLQNSSDLQSWTTQPSTTGQSSTNWPVGAGAEFFRLIK